MNDSDDIVKEFLVESYENLDRLDRELITLEKNPNDRDILASIFRTIHTIKGTSGFLAFNKLGAVAHVGESLLGRLRDGQLVLDPEITTGLLAMVDAVRQMLASIEATGIEGERDDGGLISRLTRLQEAPEATGKSKRKASAELKAAAAAAAAGSQAIGGPSPKTRSAKVREAKVGEAKVGEMTIGGTVEKPKSGGPPPPDEIATAQPAA